MNDMGQNIDDVSYKDEINKLTQQVDDFWKLFDTFIDPCLITDSNGAMKYVNHAACRLFQLSHDEFINFKISDFLIVNPSNEIGNINVESFAFQQVEENRWSIQLLNGEIKQIEYNETILNHKGDHFYKLTDITLERSLEREKKISMQLFMDLFNHGMDSIVIHEKSGIIIDVNPAFCGAISSEKHKILGKRIQDFITAESIGLWMEGIELVDLKGFYYGEMEMTVEEGGSRFDYTTRSNKPNDFYLTILRNTSEKKEMIQKLKKSERIFQELFDQTLDAVIFWKDDGTIFRVNDSACKIFESSRSALIGSHFAKYVHKDDLHLREMVETFNKNGEVRQELFFEMPNGQVKLLELTAKKHDEAEYNLTICRNVSERYQIECELRKSERKFREVFEGSFDGKVLWKNNQFIDINEAGINILEISKEELLSLSVSELLKTVPKNLMLLSKHIEIAKRRGSYTSTIPINFMNGQEKHIEFSTRGNLYSGTSLTILRDVTEKLEMQERLKKSDTLHVVGELAAGIAHEIRNPMTALKGFIQLLQGSVKEDFSTYFHVITTELQRIETIITEFLFLAKPQAMKYFKQDVHLIIKDTLELLSGQAALENIQFKYEFAEEECEIVCEGNQLKQVFINIIKNALEVSNHGGFVYVNTRILNNDHLCISISDEGPGIIQEKIKRLGEPFYTTKERGTGLGLMVSYKIIKEHHGSIEVESELGKGTTFHILLPLNNGHEELNL